MLFTHSNLISNSQMIVQLFLVKAWNFGGRGFSRHFCKLVSGRFPGLSHDSVLNKTGYT
jgi:hypothetical protein